MQKPLAEPHGFSNFLALELRKAADPLPFFRILPSCRYSRTVFITLLH